MSYTANKVSVDELVSIQRLAQMLDNLNDQLVAAGFTNTKTMQMVIVAATPELTRRAFNVS